MSELRAAIDDVGGLYSRSGLARRWDVTRSYLTQISSRADFPCPVTLIDGTREVWAAREADEWWAAHSS